MPLSSRRSLESLFAVRGLQDLGEFEAGLAQRPLDHLSHHCRIVNNQSSQPTLRCSTSRSVRCIGRVAASLSDGRGFLTSSNPAASHFGHLTCISTGMDSGLYAAYTGLLARTQALDTAANNLANAGTTGFRAQRDYFSGVLAGGIDQDASADASQVGQSVNGFGVLGGNLLDMGQGQLTTTGNPLDLALQGQGFFAIQTANGVRYTRDGSFLRSLDRRA